ncbi:phosphatase PAP2 family protein [Flavitalea sp. BT771]|uniref:phosphatase PAP2 family protein n=1 Tax=Flavitalea sp. BT771 TaxID=3063329 RepID=UPI0026E2E6A6|nr:phosphatase PAP2 family protein [Flavitalea sp. BT771]MDO6431060.1 phosphatase PAP2 family protein [Flavitalea sp. BT771]MDV6219967.1 phosphatase PAP2 family protein [Flavitalea sp. BT771]
MMKLILGGALCMMFYTIHAQSGLQSLDEHILEYLAAHRTPGQTAFWRALSNANTYVDVGIPTGLLAAGLIRNDVDMKKNALYTASSTALSILVNFTIKRIVKRPRPFITHVHFTPVYRPGDYSFPSGHAASSFGAAVALARAYPKWYVMAPALLWSSGIGYSRMYLGVHYPTDVGAGALLGIGSAFGMGFLRP